MAIGDDRALATETLRAPEARNRLAGFLLLGIGAILLFVSLFLDWFEPGLSAWTTFEVWDMVLAAVALVAVAAAASSLGVGRPLPERPVLIAAIVAPLVVVVSLVNHPPAAQGVDQDPMVGIWLALAGTLLMLLGAALAVARISVALDVAAPAAASPAPPAGRGGREPAEPAAATPPAPPGTEPTRRVVP